MNREQDIKQIEDEINFLYMYPQGSMNKIRRLEKELQEIKDGLK